MLSRPTTFVIGAGASFELNLPTGDGLQLLISKILQPGQNARGFSHEPIWQALLTMIQADGENWAYEATQYRTAAEKIIAGMPTAASIDNFLHTHRDDKRIVRLGKLAIAQAILNAEAGSHLRNGDSRLNGHNPYTSGYYQMSWYYPLVKMLSMGTLLDDPGRLLANLKFIVFNYDRCLEVILRNAVKTYYAVEDREAANIVANSVEIIHPYGSLGSLPVLAGEPSTPFGGSEVNLVTVASGIRTFTEAVDSAVVAQARHAIRTADVLVFMGFGFLAQNVELIAPGEVRRATRVHATTFGFSETDKLIIAEQLQRFVMPLNEVPLSTIHLAGGNRNLSFIDVENTSCRSLIENHRMRLMEG